MPESDLSDVSDVETENSQSIAKKEVIKINNVPALKAKLSAIQLNLDWVEKLDISINVEESKNVAEEDIDPDSKAENDFKREMSFYNQALGAVTKAFKRLHKLGIPTKRPADFFAEMAKSDSHMNKVREKLQSKQTVIERRDKIRAIREQKKTGKKIQQQVLTERKREKKKMINALKKTKKGKMDVESLLGTKKDQDIPKPNKSKKTFTKKNREHRDSRYGYGGRKKFSKSNTAESTAFGGKKKTGGMMKFNDKKFFKPRGKSTRRRR